MSFGNTANAIFTFKYWNISVIIQNTITGKNSSMNEDARNIAFFIFVIVNAISPIIYCILLGFHLKFLHDGGLRQAYRFSLVLLYSAMLGSYLLLADALRRLYTNLKDNSDVKLNKGMMCTYLISTIFYFFSLVALLVLAIKSDYHFYSREAVIGQLLGNFASYGMQAILIAIYLQILANLPKNTTDEREENLKYF
jgi:hypothetical protein